MKKFLPVHIVILSFIATLAFAQPSHKISVTVDDLPLQGISSFQNGEEIKIFNRLTDAIVKEKTPAVGFVNEDKLMNKGAYVPERIAMLEKWLNGGLELGNHNFAHKGANRVPVDEFKEDVVKGENILCGLLAKRNEKIKYFRHPFLQTGLSLETKREIEGWLEKRGYTIAPVTYDNSEWIFARAYENAFINKDEAMKERISREYIAYMKEKLEYWEGQSEKLFGRNAAQTMLIHANRLNADTYPALCKMIREKNYEFVSLEEALKDEAYKSEDTFIKNAGISWLDRWALAKGKKRDFFQGEPVCPEHIMKYAGVDSE